MGMGKKILMVVTSHRQMGDKETGIWLSEFAEPYDLFKAEGYDITVASIAGGRAPVDPRSIDAEKAQKWRDAIAALEATVPVEQVSSEGHDAIFLPGGHGTMFDLPGNARLQSLIREFYESGRVVAAVCHGPAGLVGVTLASGEPLVKGRRVTSFTDEEERAVGLDGVMPFLLETRLRELGADFVAADKWANHVETDGRLVTGQNPQSGESAARKVVELLAQPVR